jgi:hypothetical protein
MTLLFPPLGVLNRPVIREKALDYIKNVSYTFKVKNAVIKK